MLNFIMLAVGLILLMLAADQLISVAAGIARRRNIPEVLIGITLVAFGTSLPELSVSLLAAIQNNAQEIVLANVVGSNIVNGLLVIGVLGIGKTILIDHSVVKREFLFNIGASVLVFVMVLDHILEKNLDPVLGRIDGILLLTYFVLFAVQIYNRAKASTAIVEATQKSMSSFKELFLFAFLLGGVIMGGHLTVQGALGIATIFGLSQTFVGGVIVAAGTSLPELTTSIMAIRRRNFDIAVGNVIGSNLFNILAILGLSAALGPITVSSRITLDIIFMLLASVVLFGLVYMDRPEHKITRPKGLILIALYACFLLLSVKYQ